MDGLTRKEAAELIGVTEDTIKGWLRTGYLRRRQPGKRLTAEDVLGAQRNAHAGDVIPRWREDPVRVGQRLRAIREQVGLSQQQLAEMADLTHEAISRLELGQTKPQVRTLRKLISALGIEPHKLVSHEPVGLQTVSTDEAAVLLGVPRARLQVWIKNGVLPGRKVGGRWRIPLVAVHELDASGRLRGQSRRLDG
jgi:excisionase family DNA binding protein